MRVVVRRELPHPGATLDAFEIRDGYRYQTFTTNTRRGQLAFLEGRHRAHARVEDRDPDRQGHRAGASAVPTPAPALHAAPTLPASHQDHVRDPLLKDRG
jgi:hypothetical protein